MQIIEYSKDLSKPAIANIWNIEDDGTKKLRLYKYDDYNEMNKRVGDTTNEEENAKIVAEFEPLLELVFYHDESIDALSDALIYLRWEGKTEDERKREHQRN